MVFQPPELYGLLHYHQIGHEDMSEPGLNFLLNIWLLTLEILKYTKTIVIHLKVYLIGGMRRGSILGPDYII